MKTALAIGCPECKRTVLVKPNAAKAKCACGHEWDWRKDPKLFRLGAESVAPVTDDDWRAMRNRARVKEGQCSTGRC